MSAPICPTCSRAARRTSGREVYPHRPDLADKPIWRCDRCGGYVGCHPGGTKPLGTPANAELRKARSLLHERLLDPLWKTADRCGEYAPESERARQAIRRRARTRVYAFLADRLRLSAADCHTGMFDLETCRRAWRVLQGVTYSEIRAWARAEEREAA
jgi:hypothetical protein